MQFTTRIDSATQNGPEQSFVPSASGAWLPTARVAVYDLNQPNASGTALSKDAAVLVYGPAYGNPTSLSATTSWAPSPAPPAATPTPTACST